MRTGNYSSTSKSIVVINNNKGEERFDSLIGLTLGVEGENGGV